MASSGKNGASPRCCLPGCLYMPSTIVDCNVVKERVLTGVLWVDLILYCVQEFVLLGEAEGELAEWWGPDVHRSGSKVLHTPIMRKPWLPRHSI